MGVGTRVAQPSSAGSILAPGGDVGAAANARSGFEWSAGADGFDALLLAINAGPFEQPYWSSFLDRIREFVGADYASLTFRRADAAVKDVYVIRSSPEKSAIGAEDVHDILRRLSLPYATLRPNYPFSLNEIFDSGDGKNAIYTEYLNSRGFDHAFVMRIVEPEGSNCWLTIARAGPAFDRKVRGALARMTPHLALSARTLVRLERETLRADIATDAVRRLDFGWLTVDASGRVVDLDEGAERLFNASPGLNGCTRGRLVSLPRKAFALFFKTLADLIGSDATTPRAIHLIDDPWLDMLLVPIHTRPVAGATTPVAVGYVHGVEPNRPDRRERLMALFDLTANEARLALALSEGLSIAEAADALHLKIGTARNYSKRVYAKTDTRGQADLVRIILASVIAMH